MKKTVPKLEFEILRWATKVNVDVISIALVAVFFHLFGGLGIFLIILSTILVHEVGHLIVAKTLGYRADMILGIKSGVMVHNESAIISAKHKAEISLAGPAANMAFAMFFVILHALAESEFLLLAIGFNLLFATINLLATKGSDGQAIIQYTKDGVALNKIIYIPLIIAAFACVVSVVVPFQISLLGGVILVLIIEVNELLLPMFSKFQRGQR